MRLVCFLVAIVGLSLTSPAWACGSGENVFAYIHSVLPTPLPSGTFIAEVEFEPRETDDMHGAIIGEDHRAKIIRLVQGDFSGQDIIVRRDFETSCDVEFANGRRGLVIAEPLNIEDGVLVINPVMVMTLDGYRLPDGFQLPRQPSNGLGGVRLKPTVP